MIYAPDHPMRVDFEYQEHELARQHPVAVRVLPCVVHIARRSVNPVLDRIVQLLVEKKT